jgi:hypothetical protein
MLGDDK